MILCIYYSTIEWAPSVLYPCLCQNSRLARGRLCQKLTWQARSEGCESVCEKKSDKVWNNLKCLKRCAFQCIKSLKIMGLCEDLLKKVWNQIKIWTLTSLKTLNYLTTVLWLCAWGGGCTALGLSPPPSMSPPDSPVARPTGCCTHPPHPHQASWGGCQLMGVAQGIPPPHHLPHFLPPTIPKNFVEKKGLFQLIFLIFFLWPFLKMLLNKKVYFNWSSSFSSSDHS